MKHTEKSPDRECTLCDSTEVATYTLGERVVDGVIVKENVQLCATCAEELA